MLHLVSVFSPAKVRRKKQLLQRPQFTLVSFACQVTASLLSDHNIDVLKPQFTLVSLACQVTASLLSYHNIDVLKPQFTLVSFALSLIHI